MTNISHEVKNPLDVPCTSWHCTFIDIPTFHNGSKTDVAGYVAASMDWTYRAAHVYPVTKGEFTMLEVENAPDKKRTMDFIIPSKESPVVIAESSYLSTTSSGQGDKSKTEIGVDALLREHYPNAHFVGFVDGIGWYVRKNDLKRMVAAYEDVFTFHPDEIVRFERYIQDTVRGSK